MQGCRWLQLHLLLALCLSLTAAAQSPELPLLRQLRDQLVATNGLRDADVVAIISERAINDTAQRMKGLEIKLANGAVMKINAVAIELKPAAAWVKLGVEAEPLGKLKSVNFRLSGKLGSGEINGSHLRLPFQLTDVVLGAEDSSSSSVLKFLLREWLAPEKWNAALPPLEIPLQLSQALEIPAATFVTNGEMPMMMTTPAYQIKTEFWLQSFLALDGRAIIALSLQPTTEPVITVSGPIDGVDDEADLIGEITQLTQHLTTSNDLRVLVRKNAINNLLAKIAAAHALDLTAQLQPGRLRTEEIDALLGKILNYTDVESGAGQADVTSLQIEKISAERVFMRLSGQGELMAQVKGREFGIPYHLAPHGKFSLNQELVPLQILSNNDRLVVRAEPGTYVTVRVSLSIEVAGHSIGLPRIVKLQAEKWLKDLELPAIFSQTVQLPRKIVIGKNNEMVIVNSETTQYSVTNLRVEMTAEELEFMADIGSPKK